MKTTYIVPMRFTYEANICVEAESKADAEKIALEGVGFMDGLQYNSKALVSAQISDLPIITVRPAYKGYKQLY